MLFITEKNEKLCQATRTQGAFSDKVTLDIEGFTDKRVVQCYVQVVGNTFTDDSK